MKSLIRLIFGLLRRQAFGLAILACAAVSFSYPEAFLQWGSVKLASLVVPAVQLIMLGMGTTVTLGDFIRVAKNPCTVAIGVFLQFLVMPAVGFLMAKMFGFSGELAAGCVLVGSVAGGTASNVIAYLAGANVALSVSMICCSTLLSPFATPLLMKFLAGQFVAIDATAMVVRGDVELVDVAKMNNRIAAVMLVPYPPGIPVTMGGEKMSGEASAIAEYLSAREDFENLFPGYEGDIHGITREERNGRTVFRTLCIKK
jgi:predicted Na+-dependent transporter